jgi:hypothetical protein
MRSLLKLFLLASTKEEKQQQPKDSLSVNVILDTWRSGLLPHNLSRFLCETRASFGLIMPAAPAIEITDVPDDFFNLDEMEIEVNPVRATEACGEAEKPATTLIRSEDNDEHGICNESQTIKPRKNLVAILTSSIAASPLVRPKKGGLLARHFVDSQAVDIDNSGDDEDESGYSELGSFICDEDESSPVSVNSSQSTAATCVSKEGMVGFYRQSLMQSQPWGGFKSASRFMHKKAPGAKTNRRAILDSVAESSIVEIDGEDFLEDEDLDWSSIEKEHLNM